MQKYPIIQARMQILHMLWETNRVRVTVVVVPNPLALGSKRGEESVWGDGQQFWRPKINVCNVFLATKL